MRGALLDALPPREGELSSDDLLERFLGYVDGKGLSLYAAQEEALLELIGGKNVILSTPTGSGKSLVALALHFVAMAEGKRSFYTAPIKALVNEKFFALARELSPELVGMVTGDASVNPDAPVICCTAEILANMALRGGVGTPVDYVIIDEFHYYSDRERGAAWQIPLLTLPHATFLLMSATFGDARPFAERLTKLTRRETAVVTSEERPVPLDFEYRETPLHETILDLVAKEKVPVYVVNFTQRAAAEEAQNLMSHDVSTREQKKAIDAELLGFRFDSPYGKEVSRFVRHGIGLHHAGLLPKYRLLVERLAQKGLLKVISGTDTLGVGVNIPIRTVLFTKLCKFDGEKTGVLSVRDFRQISGRAGRKGFDERGSVVVQAPEHVIENLRIDAKTAGDPAKKKKLVRKKPPEKGYAHWDRTTYDRLTTAAPEPLVSRFSLSHGVLLNVLGRERGGCKAMVKLVRDSHERPRDKKELKKTGLLLYRSLLDAGILSRSYDERGKETVRVEVDLQDDFSMNHALSLYLVETIPLLDVESPEYPLQILTLVESILEDPDLILMKQLDRLKTETIAELKAQGVEYEERMAALEKLEHPKPHREFIYGTFGEFEAKHPWVRGSAGHENIRPKSIAREMVEEFLSFADYIKDYGLERAEGLLLRYLSDVYKTLVQTVPASARTEGVDEIVVFLRAIVRQVDSSLVDEWERMQSGESAPRARRDEAAKVPEGITADPRAFTVLLRNALFHLMKALGAKDYARALELAGPSEAFPGARQFEDAMTGFFAEHAAVRLDPAARSPKNTMVERGDGVWRVKQILCDEGGDDDWVIELAVDLARSDAAAAPVFSIERIAT
ncbi:MAG TPA: DUF3516 domain-containing protein [Byssovorax sp.]